MRFTVPAIIMCTIGALLSIVLGVQPVLALTACTTNTQCPSDKTCQNSLIPGIKECKELLHCNFSFDATRFAERSDMCPSGRPSCTGGICIGPASSGGGGGGGAGGGGPSGVGGPCGEYKIGQVKKVRGCKDGLQCVKVSASSKSGTCQKPLQ
jgi:hypothetical protein